MPQISKSLNHRHQCAAETTNRVNRDDDERETRKGKETSNGEGREGSRGTTWRGRFMSAELVSFTGLFERMERSCQRQWHSSVNVFKVCVLVICKKNYS